MPPKQALEEADKIIDLLNTLKTAIDLLEAVHTDIVEQGKLSPQTRSRLDNFVGFDDSE